MKRSLSLALCLFVVAFATVAVADNTVDRDYSGYQIAADQGAQLVQTSSGANGFSKAQADTFYIYGGPGTAEGKFQQFDETHPTGGLPDSQGWTGQDLSETDSTWRSTTTNGGTLGGGASGNQALAANHDDTDYQGYGNSWDSWATMEIDVAALGLNPLTDVATVRWQMQFVHDTEPQFDTVSFSYAVAGGITGRSWNTLLQQDASSYVDSTGVYVPVDFDSDLLGGVVYNPGDYVSGDLIVLRARGQSDGAWSDEDALWPTGGRGLAAIDDVVITVNSVPVSTATFEPLAPKQPTGCPNDCPEGDTSGTDVGAAVGTTGWQPVPAQFVGDFSKLFFNFQDIDPCRTNSTPQFFMIDDGTPPNNGGPSTGGSTSPTWNYGVQGAWVTNYTGGLTEGDTPLNNEIWSPEFTWDIPGTDVDDAANGGAGLGFTRWSHMPLTNGMFAVWHVRSFTQADGWDTWNDNNFIYYSNAAAYGNFVVNVTDKLLPDPELVQIAMGTVDFADFFAFPGIDAAPAPGYDNIWLKKYIIGGPVFSVRQIDLAQSGFPNDGSLTGPIRWDAAIDTGPTPGGANVAADSVAIDIVAVIPGTNVVDPVGGAGGIMRVAHVLNPAHGADPTSGARAAGFADPRIQNLTAAGVDDRGWEVWTYDAVGQQATLNGTMVENVYFFDLPDGPANVNQPGQGNDNAVLFPGDVTHYYVEATDNLGGTSTVPGVGSDPVTNGFTDFTPNTPWSLVYTVRGLPTQWDDGNKAPVAPSLLFWNDFGHRGGDDEYRYAFSQNGYQMGRDYDIYTTMGPSSLVGNGLGSAGQHGANGDQLAQYSCIVYVSGNLSNGLISDGTDAGGNGKSNDIQTMTDWHNQDAPRASVYFGDDFADGMVNQGGTAQGFINGVVGVDGIGPDVGPKIDNQTAAVIVPTGNVPGSFVASHVAFGGCLVINDFDDIVTQGGAVVSHEFTQPDNVTAYNPTIAAATWWDRDEAGNRKITSAFNHGLFYVRAVSGSTGDGTGRTAAAILLGEILTAFGGHPTSDVTPTTSLSRLSISENYPNPFNPSTKIAFSAPRKGHLSIKVYNVRGELVRTLIDGQVPQGAGHVVWDGRDSGGAGVASGIYLYQVKGFGENITEKMALVK